MPRHRLTRPEQPLAVRWLLGACEALASLKLAVVLIAASAVLLAWATLVDSQYDFKAAQFAIYGTWWFAAVVLLLGVNVLCAALIRLPWRRYQTGFAITHAGIIVVLAGCLLTRLGGIDAQMPVLEGGKAHRAFESTQRFDLVIQPISSGGSDRAATIPVPFVSGPFNWADYRDLFFFPWRVVRRDEGVVYDGDGIRLEVLDYLSDSKLAAAPPLRLQVKTAAGKADSWQPLELAPGAMAKRQQLPGGERVLYWIARSRAETEAFLDSRPEGPLGDRGQLVVHAAGKRLVVPVDELTARNRLPLGDTGLELELVRLYAEMAAMQLLVRARGESPKEMLVVADAPDMNRHDPDHGVYATYWAPGEPAGAKPAKEPSGHPAARRPGSARIDVLQGADGKLYYRAWKSPRVFAIAPLPADESRLEAFPGESDPVTFSVAKFQAQDVPGAIIEPVSFAARKAKEKRGQRRQRRARVRLTVDGRGEEFWLDGIEQFPVDLPRQETEQRTVIGSGRRVAVSLVWDSFDVGFDVYLHRFERRLDPGTSMPSHYSSLVDILARPDDDAPPKGSQPALLAKEVLITLNEPKTVVDPSTGRSYRLFQESYGGPWKPGEPLFDMVVGAESDRDRLFMSTLTVNYDPGRGLKYAGCLLVVAGVVIVFYGKTYFFKRRGSR